MTETQWLTSDDPSAMLEFLRGKASERKLRLFAVAWCRRIWHLMPDDRCREAVEVAELFADGVVGEAERRVHCERATAVQDELNNSYLNREDPTRAVAWAAANDAAFAVEESAFECALVVSQVYVVEPGEDPLWSEAGWPSGETDVRSPILRCIINPFALAPFSPSWRSSTAVTLAHQMYTTRDFSGAAILADALQDQGCEDERVLGHLRGGGPHCRGCWVVDGVLGQEQHVRRGRLLL